MRWNICFFLFEKLNGKNLSVKLKSAWSVNGSSVEIQTAFLPFASIDIITLPQSMIRSSLISLCHKQCEASKYIKLIWQDAINVTMHHLSDTWLAAMAMNTVANLSANCLYHRWGTCDSAPFFITPATLKVHLCIYFFFLSNSAQPHSVRSAMANAQISSYPPSPDALLRLLCATWVQLQWLRGEDVQDVCIWVCLLRAWAMFSEEDETTWSRHADLAVFSISTKHSNCHLISKRQS